MIIAVALIILIQIAVRKVRLKKPAPYFAGGFLTAVFLFSFILPGEKTVAEKGSALCPVVQGLVLFYFERLLQQGDQFAARDLIADVGHLRPHLHGLTRQGPVEMGQLDRDLGL